LKQKRKKIGDLPDIDPSEFDKEMFRVFDYNTLNEIKTKLWKFESFDEYTGNEWKPSLLAGKNLDSFYPMQDYIDNFSPDPELLKIQIPISPGVGNNLMNLPSLFPIPFIIEDSIDAPNLDHASTVLYKDDFNAASVDIHFSSSQPVNLSYQLFGLDLPTDDEINSRALSASYTPSEIQNQYLQLPPSIDSYKLSNTFFTNHFNILNGMISISDNAFEVANITRNYLMSPPFSFPSSIADYNRAPQGKDIVDWFCEQEEGIPSDFASAFCAFTRSFGVASRYVEGFSGLLANEIYDPVEGKEALLIKYRNVYNWAEIYVPTDVSGDGEWVQIDIFKGVPPNIFGGDYNITVSTDQSAYNRPDVATITATLISNTGSVDSKIINFTDYSSGQSIGSAITDSNGTASILISINNSQVVGPHLIEAKYGFSTRNYTLYSILGPIEVNFSSVNPTSVNKSDVIPDNTNVQGFVYDPINGQRVKNAMVNFILFQKGTSVFVPNAFDPMAKNTNSNGDFDEILSLNSSVSSGLYEIRVDFNGTWWISTPLGGFPFNIPNITDSSNRLEFNVTEALPLLFDFLINGTTPSDYENPKINRNDVLNLTAYLQLGPDPISNGTLVEFYDVTQDIPIGIAPTSSGYAQFNYSTDGSTIAGPHLIYAKYGPNYIYSYFILDEPISINLDICPSPREVNRSSSIGRDFLIHGYLNDSSNGNPIKYGIISVFLLDAGTPVDNLNLVSGSYQLDETGEINLIFSVDEATNAQNYTLQVTFDGRFNYTHIFNLPLANFIDSANGFYDLKVIDPYDIHIDFYIDGNPTLLVYNDTNLPERYNMGDIINYTVNITKSGDPATGIVTITDVFTGSVIDTYTLIESDNGYHEFYNNTNSWHAGLHQIRVDYEAGLITVIKTTYVIINESVNIFANSNKNSVLRGGLDSFIISGTVQGSGELLRGLEVNIRLINSTFDDVSGYLIGVPTSITDVGDYQFTNLIDQTCPQGEYYIRIDFNGSISYTSISLSNYMVHNSSLLIPLNITAGTQLTSLSYSLEYDPFPGNWTSCDTLYVLGNLKWDNNTAIAGVTINVTIIDLTDGNIVVYNDTVSTDLSGGFNVSIYIDVNDFWPSLKSNVEIRVSFDPIINSMDFVEFDDESIFPP